MHFCSPTLTCLSIENHNHAEGWLMIKADCNNDSKNNEWNKIEQNTSTDETIERYPMIYNEDRKQNKIINDSVIKYINNNKINKK